MADNGGRTAILAMTAVVAVAAVLVGGCAGGGAEPAGGEPSAGPSPSATPLPLPEPGPGHHELTFEWQGEPRQVLLDAPTGYDPDRPVPLVVVLHGRPGTPEQVRQASRMDELAEQEGVLVAYPAGAARTWHPWPDRDDVDDVGFLRAVVDHLVADWNAAPGEVYAAGFSMGASMIYRLAVEAADTFAAVAPVSGIFADPPDSISPAAPISVVGFVGLDDSTVVGADSLAHWRDVRDCRAGSPTPVGGDGRTSRIVASCPDGSEVVEYRIEGMRHVWPQQRNSGFEANPAIWEVFSAHAR